MTEERLGLLCNLASTLSANNEYHKCLRSYYLMRCNELTKGYGLPMKHFSKEARCPVCCLEWSRDSEVNVRSIQQQKNMGLEDPQLQKLKGKNKMHYNVMVQTCAFCKRITTTQLEKPRENNYEKETNESTMRPVEIKTNLINTKIGNTLIKKKKKIGLINNTKTETKKNTMVNVYSNAYDVFSLKNDKNTLSSTIKEPAKIIKNNKKKKDKFAGLCQKAVLASAKLKEDQQKEPKPIHNKLNLFLRPSS